MGEKIYLVLYELSKLVLNFMILNVLFIIVTIPVLVLLIQSALTSDLSSLFILLPLTSLLLPLVLFPGFQALISSVRQLIREGTNVNPLLFIKHYKKGYKTSFLIGVGFTSVLTVIGYALFINTDGLLLINTLLIVILFYTSIIAIYSLYMDAHYDMAITWIVRQSFFFILKFPLFTVIVSLIFTLVQYMIFTVSMILYILFGLTATVYLSYYLFLRKIGETKDYSVEI